MKNNANQSILRRKDVEQKTGLKRSLLYDLIAKGDFPSSINITKRCVGWIESEVESWIAERIKKERAKK